MSFGLAQFRGIPVARFQNLKRVGTLVNAFDVSVIVGRWKLLRVRPLSFVLHVYKVDPHPHGGLPFFTLQQNVTTIPYSTYPDLSPNSL
jgi:hypothetical protein